MSNGESTAVDKDLAPRMPQGLEHVIKYDPNLEFLIDKHCVALMQRNVFFATISRSVRKLPSWDIPTAAVTYDRTNDDLVMLYNPGFFTWISTREHGDDEIESIITHEFYHLILDHLGHRRKDQKSFWNISTDASINSMITGYGGKFPPGLIMPGQAPCMMDGTPIPVEPGSLQEVISKWPTLKASEWYYQSLLKAAKDNNWPSKIIIKLKKGPPGDPNGGPGVPGDGDIEVEIDSFDDHKGWDDVPEAEREFITEKVKQLVEKAVRAADQHSNGWGNIPSDIREGIRRFISRQVDWRVVLRAFIGRLLRGERALSIKRINKKYPYIHPGTKRGYQAKLLIAMDQSGSVSREAIELFFAELGNLTRKISVTILPFDHTCAIDQMFEWKKGTNPAVGRVRQGGTDFDAPCDFANDPKNRGRWDGMIMMTDGECSKPKASRMRRAWVIAPDRKLLFETEDTVISLSKEQPKADGPWR